MKRYFFVTLLITLFASAKLTVATSIPPIAALIDRIGGDEVQTVTLVHPGNSPHTYEPKPSQLRTLSRARLYFAVGVEFEHIWLPKFHAIAPQMRIVKLDDNISKLPMEAHHDHHEHDEHHDHDGLDPHLWTSPQLMMTMAHRIASALVAEDPDHSDVYHKNERQTIQAIQALDETIRRILRPLPKGTPFLVLHPSWGYFAHTYGLRQLAVEVEGKAPKGRQLVALIQTAKQAHVRTIVVQPEFSDQSARIIAKELGIGIVKLSPLTYRWEDTLLNLAKAVAQGDR